MDGFSFNEFSMGRLGLQNQLYPSVSNKHGQPQHIQDNHCQYTYNSSRNLNGMYPTPSPVFDKNVPGRQRRQQVDDRHLYLHAPGRHHMSRSSWSQGCSIPTHGYDLTPNSAMEVIHPQPALSYTGAGWEAESRWSHQLQQSTSVTSSLIVDNGSPYVTTESHRAQGQHRSQSFSTPLDFGRFGRMRDMDEQQHVSSHQVWPGAVQSSYQPVTKPILAKKFSSADSMAIDGFVYQVQFKRAHRNYILSPSAPRDIIPGDFVKVEADRGEDMGVVLAKIPVECFEEVAPTAGYRGRGFSSGQGEKKYLFRRASKEERAALKIKVQDEELALETIRQKVLVKGYPMRVLEAEYQFDRHKLIFYFEAENRIDFRDLVSELFSQYKTRIWMQQVDPLSISLHDVGTDLARSSGFIPPRPDDDLYFSSKRSSFSQSDDTTKASSIGVHSLLEQDFLSSDDVYFNSPSSDVSLDGMFNRASSSVSDVWGRDSKI